MAIAILSYLLLFSTELFAQTASQITPPSFRPEFQKRPGVTTLSSPDLITPPGAEKLSVRLSGVTVKNGFAELEAATLELEKRLTQGVVSGADIFRAARDLETEYANAGFVLVRIALPPQTITNGTKLTLLVVDGYIESIDVTSLPNNLRSLISKLVSPLIGQHRLSSEQLERRLLLSGDTPGLVLKTSLVAGTKTGASRLTIGANYQSINTNVSFDDSLSQSLGKTSAGVGFDLNSIAGLGEQIYVRASGHPSSGDNGYFEKYATTRSLTAGFIVPLWIDGLSFNTEATDARTTPQASLGVQTTDVFQRASFRTRYYWERSRSFNFWSEAALDFQNEVNSLFVETVPVSLFQDRLRIARFTNNFDGSLPWNASWSFKTISSFGLNALGARSASDATTVLPLSRQGADSRFQKLEINATYSQSLLDHLALSLSARAQSSFNKPLLKSETFGIASSVGLSAFDQGAISGDQGHVLRAELLSPWSMPSLGSSLDTSVTPYLFAAYGEADLVAPTSLETAKIVGSAQGAGIRFGGSKNGTLSNGSMNIEYGSGIKNDGTTRVHRINAGMALKF